MVYGLIFGMAILASVLSKLATPLARASGLTLAIVLVVFAGMRADSVDYAGYQVMYELLVSLNPDYPERLFFGKDVLFGVMMDGLSRVGASLQWLFLFAALLSVGIKHLAFEREFGSKTAVAWLVTLCLSFFLHDFTQIRTAIAVAICFLALQHMLARRTPQWLALSLLACGFHLSAVVFIPISAVLLAPPGRRLIWWMLVAGGLVIGLLGMLQLVNQIDPRLENHGEVTGLNWTALAVAVFKFALLTAAAWTLRPPRDGVSQAWRTVWPSVMLVGTGVILLFLLRGTATALAFRLYEFFDAFSVWVIAICLLQRRPLPILLGLFYCAFGILLQYLPGLLPPYEFAAFASLLR